MPLSISQFFILSVPLIFLSCGSEKDTVISRQSTTFIDGITLVAPARPFTRNPASDIQKLGADWVAVVPYGFTPGDEAVLYFNQPQQWWGETKEGIITTIRYCQAAGLRTMLKPQVWAHGKWSGDIYYDHDADWRSWEDGYRKYLFLMADIADSMDVDMLCIGTELKGSVANRPDFWISLIDQIREGYHGKLTYAANWDFYRSVPFWKNLDYIGIDAYFPLTKSPHPDREVLILAWKPIVAEIGLFSKELNKPVLFTEFGYLSTDYNTHNTWEREDQLEELKMNEEAQATALDVLLECFYPHDWWAGGFQWKWYPANNRIRHKSKDYTVQGKQAQEVLQKWYRK